MSATSRWEVRLELLLTADGLDDEELSERLSRHFAARGIDALPQLTLASDGTAETVGANLTVPATTPGDALDQALERLRGACAELDIPAGPLDEAVVRRADVDPRLAAGERHRA